MKFFQFWILVVGIVHCQDNRYLLNQVQSEPKCSTVSCIIHSEAQDVKVYFNNRLLRFGYVKKVPHVIFRSCNDQNPGELTVTGSNPDQCQQGGFMMLCKSSTKKGPWHNFKTDENHWTTAWFSKPCQTKSQTSEGLVSYLQKQGVKMIWTPEFVHGILYGTPQCTEINCQFTIDDSVESVFYNRNHLKISGDVDKWNQIKTFHFRSCDSKDPGKLIIKGSGFQNQSQHGYQGYCQGNQGAGLILTCTSWSRTSLWHNFKSDSEHWTDQFGQKPCVQNDSWFAKVKGLQEMMSKGAQKIWAPRRVVTMIGSPQVEYKTSKVKEIVKNHKDCADVKCSFTMGNYGNHVGKAFFNGKPLRIRGNKGMWLREKVVEFQACDNKNPGELTITGTYIFKAFLQILNF